MPKLVAAELREGVEPEERRTPSREPRTMSDVVAAAEVKSEEGWEW